MIQRFGRPAPTPLPEKSVFEIQNELLDKVRPALQDIWPSSDAPIQDFDVIVGAAGVAVDVHYQATKDLGEVPVKMVLQSLRTKLGIPDLALKTERVRPPREPEKSKCH